MSAVVATYPARHYADLAKNYLEDRNIESLVAADDVHVTLQLTEGVRLFVLEHDAQAAYDALAEAKLLPDTIAMDPEPEDEEGEEGEDS
jgi:hypothetical protein